MQSRRTQEQKATPLLIFCYPLLLLCLGTGHTVKGQNSSISWKTLLQGMETTGWTIEGSDVWSISRQGVLVGEARNGAMNQWIWKNQAYKNFNLRFLYFLETGATAAVAVRVRPGSGAIAKRGYEVVLGKGPGDWFVTGSVLEIQPSRPRKGETEGGPHSCQISALGDRLSVHIDGVKKVDLHDRRSLEGQIGFRLPDTGLIQISELEIQHLPDMGPLPRTMKETMDAATGRFVSLMPGEKLEGWRMLWPEDGRWYLKEDVLIGAEVERNSWLFTKKDFRDFILRLDFKCPPGANGGVIYRYPWPPTTGDRPGGPMARAAETQIIFNDVEEPGAMHGRITVRKGIAKPGEWNKYELYCCDDRIQVYINDVKVTDWHNAVAREGRIGLQSLGASSIMSYRNIEIKEMPRDFQLPE